MNRLYYIYDIDRTNKEILRYLFFKECFESFKKIPFNGNYVSLGIEIDNERACDILIKTKNGYRISDDYKYIFRNDLDIIDIIENDLKSL